MNVLDENIRDDQALFLVRRRVHVRKIGAEIGRFGMHDTEIIALLHQLSRPTFFTLDVDYYKRRLRHKGYCLVHLVIEADAVAEYVIRVLRHPALNSKTKRMGTVIQVEDTGLTLWRVGEQGKTYLDWDE